MSLEQCEEIATELFKKEPAMACRLKEALDELLDVGFHDETVWHLYKAFLPAWTEHTSPKEMLSLKGQKERQRLIDEAAGM